MTLKMHSACFTCGNPESIMTSKQGLSFCSDECADNESRIYVEIDKVRDYCSGQKQEIRRLEHEVEEQKRLLQSATDLLVAAKQYAGEGVE